MAADLESQARAQSYLAQMLAGRDELLDAELPALRCVVADLFAP